jgi:hypothetical protein
VVEKGKENVEGGVESSKVWQEARPVFRLNERGVVAPVTALGWMWDRKDGGGNGWAGEEKPDEGSKWNFCPFYLEVFQTVEAPFIGEHGLPRIGWVWARIDGKMGQSVGGLGKETVKVGAPEGGKTDAFDAQFRDLTVTEGRWFEMGRWTNKCNSGR